ncbi:MAG: VWA domain-containing protein [Planctomycetia bacterium]|nr:VWA domain-containing protein [Planctomycetia bacterium]
MNEVILSTLVKPSIPPVWPPLAWSWGEPQVLFWSVAVAIPVLIHLYGRLTVRRMDFPAIRFLPESVTSRRSPDRLREILLLLLRCAVILSLVTAAAIPRFRPETPVESLVTSRTPMCRIFVIDGSASMSAQNRVGHSSFELAIRRIREILAAESPEENVGERLGILMVGDSQEPEIGGLTSRRSGFLRRLERLQCTRGEADLREAFTQLLRLPDEPNFLKPDERYEIVILSDLDRATWKGYDPDRTPPSFQPEWASVAQSLAERAKVRLEPIGDPPSENIGLTELLVEAVSEEVVTPGAEPLHQVRVKLESRGGNSPRTTPVTLCVDGVVVGRREVSVDPDTTVSVDFDPIPIGSPEETEMTGSDPTENEKSSRFSQVTVTRPPDRFPPDDQCQRSVRRSEWIRILLVNASPEQESVRWLRAALEPLGDAGPVRVTTISMTELPFAEPERYDGIVLFDVPSIPTETEPVLRRYAEQGGGLLIFPGESQIRDQIGPATTISSANTALSGDSPPWFPATTGELRDHPRTALISGESSGTNAGLFERFTGTSVAEVPLLRYRDLTLRPGGRVLWRSTEGDPLLAESTIGSGHVLVFAFRPIPSESPLVVLPAFVPLIQETLRWLCAAERQFREPSESLSPIPTAELGFRFLTYDPDFRRAVHDQLGWDYGTGSYGDSTTTVTSAEIPEHSPVIPEGDSSDASGPGFRFRSFLRSSVGIRWLTPVKLLISLAILFWLVSLYLSRPDPRGNER